jgi:integrase
MTYESTEFDFKVLKNIIRWLGCRVAEGQILRWSDIDFENNTITLRGKDSKGRSGDNYDNLPTRTSPLWPQLRVILWEAYCREMDRALELGVDIRKHVVNDTLQLEGKPEFCTYQESEWEVIKAVDGRYGESSAAGKRLKSEIVALGFEIYPQPMHGLRDYRANELAKQGYTVAEIDAWLGNSEAVRRKHYSATAVNADDIAKALARENSRMVEVQQDGDGQTNAGGTELDAGGTTVAQELPQVSPSKGIEQPKIVSILANASDTDLQALVQYAQQVYEKRKRIVKS